MVDIGHEAMRSSGPSNSVTTATANDNASLHVGNNYNLSKDDYLEALWVTDPEIDKERIEDAKGGLLKESYQWILENRHFKTLRDNPESHLLWIKGDPGKGKTMLLCGIINELMTSIPSETLITYFFCQAADEQLNNATAILRGLILMLIKKQDCLGDHVRKHYRRAGKQLYEGVNTRFVLSKIFLEILKDPAFKGAYIIVDALDECEKDLKHLLDLVTLTESIPGVKWIMSSRHIDGIEHGLKITRPLERLSLELKENAEEVKQAVDTYIDHCVVKLSDVYMYGQDTRNRLRDVTRQKAHGTFLWVSLVFHEIGKTRLLRRELEEVMTEIPVTLEGLYLRMIDQIRNLGRKRPELCRKLLATVVTALRPLRLEELGVVSDLIGEYSGEIKYIANMCRPFLTIQGETVSIIHQSAKDFLSTNEFLFPSGMTETHRTIFSTSLQAMSETLQRDIYRLGHMDHTIIEIKKPKEDPLASIQYSCVFWVDHLKEGLSQFEKLALDLRAPPAEDHVSFTKIPANFRNILQDNGLVSNFLMESYLPWLEALSLLRSIPGGVTALTKLERFIEFLMGSSNLLEFVRDARRFCLQQSSVMADAPLQVYASALLFSPRQSIVRRQFEERELGWISTKPIVGECWDPCLATVVVDDNASHVKSVAFAPDGKLIASGSSSDMVRLWHADTGACQETFGSHGWAQVDSVAFSPCGDRLATASGSDIKLWCTQTFSWRKTLKGHGSLVFSIAFSPDGAYLASAARDDTVKIWNVATGTCQRTLSTPNLVAHLPIPTRWQSYEWPRDVSFSPDGRILAVASGNIQLWDAITGKCQPEINQHTEVVNSVAFSVDGQYIASGSADKTVKLCNVQTGQCQWTFAGHIESVHTVAFSPDGRFLASGSVDTSIRLWDLSKKTCRAEFSGHTSKVNSIAFSPDGQCLVSGSADSTFKIWDLKDSDIQTTIIERHNAEILLMVLSPDAKHLASGSGDGTIKVWDTSTGKCRMTTEGYIEKDNEPTCTEPAFTANGQQLATVAHSNVIEVWDFENCGPPVQLQVQSESAVVDGHITAIAFSPNGRFLAYVYKEYQWQQNVGILEIDTRECHHVAWYVNDLEDGRAKKLSFHPTGKYLGFKGFDGSGSVLVWDISSDPSGEPLERKNTVYERVSYYPEVGFETLPFEDRNLITVEWDKSGTNCGLSDDRKWITCRGNNKVLLPFDYQTGLSVSTDNMIAIMGRRRNVIIIRFGDDAP